MPRYFTHYWANDTAYSTQGDPLTHAAGEDLDKVQPGDVVYPITVIDGVLFPLGKMTIEAVTNKAEAAKILGTDDLWEASTHIIAKRGEVGRVRLDLMLDTYESEQIMVIRKEGPRPPKILEDGALDRQTFRGTCEITEESAHLLDEHLSRPIIELDQDEEDLILQLRGFANAQVASRFLDLARDVVQAAGLTNEDPRLSMTVRQNDSRLAVNFNQRYVFFANAEDPAEFGFLLPRDAKIPGSPIAVDRFEDFYKAEIPPVMPFYEDFESFDIEPYRDEWLGAASQEAAKGKSSTFRKFHNEAFYRAAFDPDFRARVLNAAFRGEVGIFAENVISTSVDKDLEAQAIEEELKGFEGDPRMVLVKRLERDSRLRARAIAIHGTACQACGFDFYDDYGDHGKAYIEVHHKVPLASYEGGREVDPREDMAVLCANCHRMIHRSASNPLTVEELTAIVDKQREIYMRRQEAIEAQEDEE